MKSNRIAKLKRMLDVQCSQCVSDDEQTRSSPVKVRVECGGWNGAVASEMRTECCTVLYHRVSEELAHWQLMEILRLLEFLILTLYSSGCKN